MQHLGCSLFIRLHSHHGFPDRGRNRGNSVCDSKSPQVAGRPCIVCYFQWHPNKSMDFAGIVARQIMVKSHKQNCERLINFFWRQASSHSVGVFFFYFFYRDSKGRQLWQLWQNDAVIWVPLKLTGITSASLVLQRFRNCSNCSPSLHPQQGLLDLGKEPGAAPLILWCGFHAQIGVYSSKRKTQCQHIQEQQFIGRKNAVMRLNEC